MIANFELRIANFRTPEVSSLWFVARLCLALYAMFPALSSAAEAEQARRIHRIGFLSIRSEPGSWDEALNRGLRDLGYVEGKNVAVAYRWAEGEVRSIPRSCG
jgi:hypothetical protein